MGNADNIEFSQMLEITIQKEVGNFFELLLEAKKLYMIKNSTLKIDIFPPTLLKLIIKTIPVMLYHVYQIQLSLK